MKKFFVSLALVAFSVFAHAQVVIPVHEGQGLLRKSNEKIVLNNAITTPNRAASLDNTEVWGYYLGNDLSEENIYVGGAESAATYYVGYFVPGDGILKGSSINGVNIPIYTTTYMTNIKVWISEDLETNLVTKDVTKSTLKQASLNAVALDEPFAIPETGVFVGVQFTISMVSSDGDYYPIILEGSDNPEKNSLIMKIVTSAGTYDWEDYSDFWGGHYAMQLFCSNLTLPERSASFKSASSVVTLPGEEVSIPVVISSDGSEGVNSIDYIVEINGNKTSKHLDLKTPIAGGFSKSGNDTISFTAPEACSVYTANISIEKVNGEANEASGTILPTTHKVVTKIVTRKTVVEEYTGTQCGYCPRGWAGMEYMKENKENFIGIAFHQYPYPYQTSGDPMFLANYYSASSLGISGAPGCAMDRKLLGIDPYYGTGSGYDLYPTITDDFDNCNAQLPDVDVTVNGKFNDDFTAVDVTTNIEYLTDGGEYTVVYVLTADGLTGTSASWKQSNYYYSYNPVGDPLIDQFCKGGIYGTSSVALVYNDVMIGSSYNNNGINQAPALTGEAKAGEIATGSYTIDMPTKATLKGAINNNEVYAVVLVIASDGTIANAAKAKVTGAETSIEKTVVDTDSQEVIRYNTAGQQINAPQKGLNIIKHADGKTSKVIVK